MRLYEREATSAITLNSPAKLNLFLHITGQREDGYHELQTVFQLLDLCDQISFETTPDNAIILQDTLPEIPVKTNLIWQAANLLKKSTQYRQGARISLRKSIPMGAGLGGGSSNAATTLIALNQLWGTGLSLATLQDLSGQLGADVPVFVGGRSAWAEGTGDQIIPLNLPTPWYLVIFPNCRVCTKEIFLAKELTRNREPITMSAFQESACVNDCEPVTRSRYPVVSQTLAWLRQFGPARMSGTGSSCFLACQSPEEAHRIYAKAPSEWQVFVTRGLCESPLHKQLGLL